MGFDINELLKELGPISPAQRDEVLRQLQSMGDHAEQLMTGSGYRKGKWTKRLEAATETQPSPVVMKGSNRLGSGVVVEVTDKSSPHFGREGPVVETKLSARVVYVWFETGTEVFRPDQVRATTRVQDIRGLNDLMSPSVVEQAPERLYPSKYRVQARKHTRSKH